MSNWISITEKKPEVDQWIMYLTPFLAMVNSEYGTPDVDDICFGRYAGGSLVIDIEDAGPDYLAVWAELPNGFAGALKRFVSDEGIKQ